MEKKHDRELVQMREIRNWTSPCRRESLADGKMKDILPDRWFKFISQIWKMDSNLRFMSCS
jgi:hypothetical protein